MAEAEDYDGPTTDGCGLHFDDSPDDDETAGLRALFPAGESSPHTASDWAAVLGDSEDAG